MIRQKQPNSYTCLPTSFAMCIGMDVKQFMIHVGHDGSESVWPLLDHPYDVRCFHFQEMVATCYHLGWSVICMDRNIGTKPPYSDAADYVMNQYHHICHMMAHEIGVVIGMLRDGRRHAMAWDGKQFVNPSNTDHNGFEIEMFCAVIKNRIGK